MKVRAEIPMVLKPAVRRSRLVTQREAGIVEKLDLVDLAILRQLANGCSTTFEIRAKLFSELGLNIYSALIHRKLKSLSRLELVKAVRGRERREYCYNSWVLNRKKFRVVERVLKKILGVEDGRRQG